MFIENPNLPTRKVKFLIIDRRVPLSIENKIRALGINIIKTPYCKDLHLGISSHPDILLCHIGKNKVVVAPNVFEFAEELRAIGINAIMGNTSLMSTYPKDIAYNVCIVGRFAIHNFKYTDREVLKGIEENNLIKINVKQGYTKCSILVVNENAIITSDPGITKEVKKYGIDVLTISPGNIKLPGFEYGFIGGAGGLVDRRSLFLFGELKRHQDYNSIEKFLSKHGVEVITVNSEELIDLGSLIPIVQEE